MPAALLLSPHLDDVAFSCGGLAALLVDRGWRVVMATAFTRSVVPATGFALACQLDKGLPPDVDYMAIRREEDRLAAAILGVEARWLDLLEAPHRGYHSPAALFGERHTGDDVGGALALAFTQIGNELEPDLVLTPQGLGNHVDHQHVILAAQQCFPAGSLAYYRDTPYAIRQRDAAPFPSVPRADAVSIDITASLPRKIAAAQAYSSQIGFQFGGAAALAEALEQFALKEGGINTAERFVGDALMSCGL